MENSLFVTIHLSVVQKLLQVWFFLSTSSQRRSSATAIVVFNEALHEIAMNLPEQSKGKKRNQEGKLRLIEHLASAKIALYRDIAKYKSSHTKRSQSHENTKVAQRIMVSFCR